MERWDASRAPNPTHSSPRPPWRVPGSIALAGPIRTIEPCDAQQARLECKRGQELKDHPSPQGIGVAASCVNLYTRWSILLALQIPSPRGSVALCGQTENGQRERERLCLTPRTGQSGAVSLVAQITKAYHSFFSPSSKADWDAGAPVSA